MGTQTGMIINRLGRCWFIQPLLQPLQRDEFIGLWGRKQGKEPMYFYSFLTMWYIHFPQKTRQTLSKVSRIRKIALQGRCLMSTTQSSINSPNSEFKELCPIGTSLQSALWDRLVLLTTFYKRGIHREKCLAWQHSRALIRTPGLVTTSHAPTLACKSHNLIPYYVCSINDFHKHFSSMSYTSENSKAKPDWVLINYNRAFRSSYPPLNFSSFKMIRMSIKRYLICTPKSISWSIHYIILYFKKVSYFKQIPEWNTLELNYYQFWSCKN